MVTLKDIAFAIAMIFMVYCIYNFYVIWDWEQKEKKRAKKRPKAGPPMSKAEYDCTENFYHD